MLNQAFQSFFRRFGVINFYLIIYNLNNFRF